MSSRGTPGKKAKAVKFDLSAQENEQHAGPRKSTAAQFGVRSEVVFLIFSVCHALAAFKAPIQDCDETFNYWEPTHYLTHGHSFQTWEYAPRYAIRSWAYAALHALPVALLQRLWSNVPKPVLFYAVRLLLGLVCAACEARFFFAISKTLNERVAILFLLIMSTSPGMFHASVAYLPSSFAMYTAMLGASAFVNLSTGYRSVSGIVWFGIGAILGWPFAAALILPFLAEELVMAAGGSEQTRYTLIRRWAAGIGCCLLVLAVQTTFDSALYRKLVVVPLNIVLYNVFSSKGPDLYGTEPWHFYIRNLSLNFHVWFFLSLAALPLQVLRSMFGTSTKTRSLRGFYFFTPLYLWLAVFTLQPHKEERFMYPAYPFIALNAAYALHQVLAVLGDSRPGSLVSHIPVMLRLTAILLFITTALTASMLRIAASWSAFAAPLAVYQPLSAVQQDSVVCLGKEWYRFPSHYLLPDNVQARFIRSEFRGLLPGQFTPIPSTYPFSATWNEPSGMNDDNIEDLGKYMELAQCDYLVDSHLPSTAVTTFEPSYIHDSKQWQKVKCVPYLDAASTSVIGRLLWVPDSSLVPSRLRRIWGEYCLLKRVSP